MSSTLLKALIALTIIGALFSWSAISSFRRRTVWNFIQLLGAGCLVVVALTHICETVGLFPSMQWGSPNSVGHYLDLLSAILGVVLFPIGYLGAKRRG
jgi:hypothetical protein